MEFDGIRLRMPTTVKETYGFLMILPFKGNSWLSGAFGITASLRVAVTLGLSRTKGASVAQSIKDAPRVSTFYEVRWIFLRMLKPKVALRDDVRIKDASHPL